MKTSSTYQAGNFIALNRLRALWFPTVAAARANHRLFDVADAIAVKGRGVFYADKTSAGADTGTESTGFIKLDAVSGGRFVRETPSSAFSVPNAGAMKTASQTTTSAVLEDVTNTSATITLTAAQTVCCWISYNIGTASGGSASEMEVALVLDGAVVGSYVGNLAGLTDKRTGSRAYITPAPLAAGAHTFRIQFRRVSGAATPAMLKADVVVLGTVLQP